MPQSVLENLTSQTRFWIVKYEPRKRVMVLRVKAEEDIGRILFICDGGK